QVARCHRPALACESAAGAAGVADGRAVLVDAAEDLPAEAADGLGGGDPGQVLGGPVPGADGEVGADLEERVARAELVAVPRRPGHGGSQLRCRGCPHRGISSVPSGRTTDSGSELTGGE